MDSGISDPRLARLARAYEALRRDNLAELLSLYADQAFFKDPFNEVHGRAETGRVFAHMFEQLDQPRFTVNQGMAQGDSGFLLWELAFVRQSGEPMCICGASHLQFDADGLVVAHRDFWDPMEEIFAKLPMLGPVTRWVQARMSASR
ncbi:Ketosteroid isomerase-related protein [Delftia tsuruhatensis]|uniref:nuclear transport factor 2 family protein n=1 Tax=Delftia tsuruhatensis TaxID=180282 RepID=UPI001E784A02|nr:nuclear transport factor 2 family protein [Delftia tsuruhatensis]CAB5711353.1 Ketosteroid isomerase-related protein [Delftia tsuruhatensis]CAC9686755.1 Ketosteroid isomerase-related protein [Delftia tsuruhatensis]